MQKNKGNQIKTKRIKPKMSEEELRTWHDRRRKTSYHKSKKDYDRKKLKKENEDYED